MNLLLHFVIATALIAALILFRIFADRHALRSRLRQHRTDTGCEQAGCFQSCDPEKAKAEPDHVSEKNDLKRSAYHAP